MSKITLAIATVSCILLLVTEVPPLIKTTMVTYLLGYWAYIRVNRLKLAKIRKK